MTERTYFMHSVADTRHYRAGRQAARNGQPRSHCPWTESDLRARCWWLAGHWDQQQETRRCTPTIRDDHGGSALSLTRSAPCSPSPFYAPHSPA